jgi:hypothetical protein
MEKIFKKLEKLERNNDKLILNSIENGDNDKFTILDKKNKKTLESFLTYYKQNYFLEFEKINQFDENKENKWKLKKESLYLIDFSLELNKYTESYKLEFYDSDTNDFVLKSFHKNNRIIIQESFMYNFEYIENNSKYKYYKKNFYVPIGYARLFINRTLIGNLMENFRYKL